MTIIYAGLAFYFPKTKAISNIFVNNAVMFLIFSSLPFSLKDGLNYMLDGVIVVAAFIGFYLLFDFKRYAQGKLPIKSEPVQGNQITAMIVVLSLTVAWIVSHYLSLHATMSHLYWIALAVLVVIQGSQQKTIRTSFKRIGVNAFGAIATVVLFSY